MTDCIHHFTYEWYVDIQRKQGYGRVCIHCGATEEKNEDLSVFINLPPEVFVRLNLQERDMNGKKT